jgi:hypothetical protein
MNFQDYMPCSMDVNGENTNEESDEDGHPNDPAMHDRFSLFYADDCFPASQRFH